ncbi:MAG: fatty acid desaturase [Acidobacteria bacterium]|nr:fatty acid desaturase [Acidobacteriota bacterium]
MNKHTPLSEVRRSLRVKWYRSPIAHPRLRELSRRSDLRGAFQAFGHLSLWAMTGALCYYFFKQRVWAAFAAALYLHGTVGSFFKGIAGHELSHGTVFAAAWLNRLLLRIYSVLGWWNCQEYAMSHTYHHRYTLYPEGDREVVLPRNPTLRFLALLQLFTVNVAFDTESNGIIPTLRRIFLTAFNRHHGEWPAALYEGHPEARRQAVNWARLVIAFHLVAIGAFIGIGEPILAVLVSGHLFIANGLRYFIGLPMHCGLRNNVPDFRKCVRTITLNPIVEFLYWHMNWHTEHHMFAGGPCYNLRKLHDEVKSDMPRPRTLIGAWREMRRTWRRQQDEPGYQFDTPLPPTARSAITREAEAREEDALEASIGDLAPKALATPNGAAA